MNQEYIKISELNNYIKSLLDKDHFLNKIYLKGEISNFKNHTRGHLYFTLKDDTSRISAVMFQSSAVKLTFTPEDGMNVLVEGRISAYPAQGTYQIYVDKMEPDGLGALYIEYEKLKKKHPDLKLLHASRHLTIHDDIKKIMNNIGLKYGLRSNNDSFKEYDIILLDTLGELAKMYSYAYIAFIGGSFCKTGGHNPLEAAIWNRPVISGPDTHNFKDIYKFLTTFKAGFVVNNLQGFFEIADKLLSDNDFYKRSAEACKDVFDAQHGALDFVINIIKLSIPQEAKV